MSILMDLMSGDVGELIKRRRGQMLVHSCLYYEMDESIIDDHTWQSWADELEQLQTNNPEQCKQEFFDFEFKDWTGATGNHLPLRDPWVIGKARQILRIHNERPNTST